MFLDKNKSIVERMSEEGIFSIEKSTKFEIERAGLVEGSFTLWDGCDSYYRTHLTRDELRKLGEELIELSYEDA